MEGNFIIETFTKEWWICTVIVISFISGFLYFMGKQSDVIKKRVALVLALIASTLVISWQLYFIFTGTWTANISLPLQLCGISKILGAIVLFRFNQSIFEFILLLGLAGAMQAILTPQFEIEITTYSIIEYYMSHSMIIIMPLYLLYVLGNRVKKRAWLYTFLLGVGTLSLVGIVNYFVGGNYIFLCGPPIAPNPLLIGEWPYYLIGFLVFGWINIIIFYLIFDCWGKWLDKRRKAIEGT